MSHWHISEVYELIAFPPKRCFLSKLLTSFHLNNCSDDPIFHNKANMTNMFKIQTYVAETWFSLLSSLVIGLYWPFTTLLQNKVYKVETSINSKVLFIHWFNLIISNVTIYHHKHNNILKCSPVSASFINKK